MQSEYQGGTASAQLSTGTHKVLRNTYMLLGLSMLPTVLGASIGLNMNFFVYGAASDPDHDDTGDAGGDVRIIRRHKGKPE